MRIIILFISKQTKKKKKKIEKYFYFKMLNSTIIGSSLDLDEINDEKDSIVFLNRAKLINICLTIIVFTIGFIGNLLIIYVFTHRRYRLNSSNVYLLCLAICDTCFLVIHLFEDTIRTLEDIIYENLIFHEKFKLNITDRYVTTCFMVNYLRYILRFISAYIIVTFTIQRAYIVYFPLRNKFKSKKSAWYTVVVILIISIFLNFWIPYIFELKTNENDHTKSTYCDVKTEWKNVYFIITIIYITLTILIPIMIVFVFNTIIIVKTRHADLKRKQNFRVINNFERIAITAKRKPLKLKIVLPPNKTGNSTTTTTSSSSRSSCKTPINQHLITYNLNRRSKKNENSYKLANILILTSFSYAFFNLPYLITWFLFFYEIALNENNLIIKNYLFGTVQYAEIFYLLNYGAKFYIYCLSGSLFRRQLNSTSIKISKNNFSN
jgi:hypothetical protein